MWVPKGLLKEGLRPVEPAVGIHEVYPPEQNCVTNFKQKLCTVFSNIVMPLDQEFTLLSLAIYSIYSS